MSRKVLSSQSESLSTMTDSWEENLRLNQRRNELLENLVRATERAGYTEAQQGGRSLRLPRRRGGGGGGGLIGGAVGLVGALLAADSATGNTSSNGAGSSDPGGVVDPNPSLPNRYNTPTAFRNALKKRTPDAASSGGGSSGDTTGLPSGTPDGETVGKGIVGGIGTYGAYKLASSSGRFSGTTAPGLFTPNILASSVAMQERRARQTSGKTWWEQVVGNNGATSGVGGGGMTTAMMGVPWGMMGFKQGQNQNSARKSKGQRIDSLFGTLNLTVNIESLFGGQGMDQVKREVVREVNKELSKEIGSNVSLSNNAL